ARRRSAAQRAVSGTIACATPPPSITPVVTISVVAGSLLGRGRSFRADALGATGDALLERLGAARIVGAVATTEASAAVGSIFAAGFAGCSAVPPPPSPKYKP